MSHPYLFVGVMSGTSADGIDSVLVDFAGTTPKLVGSHSQPYSPSLRQSVIELCSESSNEIDRMGQLDAQLGVHYAESVNTLLKENSVLPDQVIAIGCHGQTIRHRPVQSPSITIPFSLQIGDPNTVALLTGIKTVSDFRRKDVALGGQGAPLVPAFHHALFYSAKLDRCIANIGGIANITGLHRDGRVTGFDTGPGNTLMDAWISKCQGVAYDQAGKWATSGQVHTELLNQLLHHPYFALPAPKSTGREDFNIDWLNSLLGRINTDIPDENVQATLLELTARTLCDEVSQHSPNSELIICGGGAFNTALLSRIKALYSGNRVTTSLELGVSPTWVEAMAFAWLAMRRIEGLPGNVPSVTGASKEAVLGSVHCP